MPKEKEGHCHCQKTAVGKAFASSSLSINQAVFMARSEKASDSLFIPGTQQGDTVLDEKKEHCCLKEFVGL